MLIPQIPSLFSFLRKGVYNPRAFIPPRDIAPSGFRPLRKIPHCCPPQRSGPCLSPSVADHPLRSATDHGLGKLLSHQLANQTQARPLASFKILRSFALKLKLPFIEFQLSFPKVILDQRVGSYVLLTRSPLFWLSLSTAKPQDVSGQKSFDLHVLSMSPAFILSQDQTLRFKVCSITLFFFVETTIQSAFLLAKNLICA